MSTQLWSDQWQTVPSASSNLSHTDSRPLGYPYCQALRHGHMPSCNIYQILKLLSDMTSVFQICYVESTPMQTYIAASFNLI